MYISNTTQAGIRLEAVNTGIVSDCWLESCGRNGYSDNHGIMLYSTTTAACHSIKIVNNVIRSTSRKGIATFAPTAEVYDVLIQGNSVSGSGLGNIYVGGPLHRDIRIVDNWCSSGYVNIQLGEAKNSTISRNVCVNSTGDFGIGVYGLSACSISGNTVKDSRTCGISLFQVASETCEALLIDGNTVMNSNRADGPEAAVQLSATFRSIVSDNIIFDESGAVRSKYGVFEFPGSNFNQVQNNLVFGVSIGSYNVVGSSSVLLASVPGQYYEINTGLKVNHASLTLASGTNNNIVLPDKCGTVTATGPTGAYQITGIAGGVLGRSIKLVNSTAHRLTLVINSASSSPGNRLYLTGSVNKTIEAWSAVSLTYVQNQGSSFWMDV